MQHPQNRNPRPSCSVYTIQADSENERVALSPPHLNFLLSLSLSVCIVYTLHVPLPTHPRALSPTELLRRQALHTLF